MIWTKVTIEITSNQGKGRAALRALARKHTCKSEFWEQQRQTTSFQVIDGIIKSHWVYFDVLFPGLTRQEIDMLEDIGYDVEVITKDLKWVKLKMSRTR